MKRRPIARIDASWLITWALLGAFVAGLGVMSVLLAVR